MSIPAQDRDAYLGRQLIAYIGNKRRLLASLEKLFRSLEERAPVTSLLDPFAGSGAVSRLGRVLGYRVYASDWEEYSAIINRCHLATLPQEVENLFRPFGGLSALLDALNRSEDEPERRYFSRYYAPQKTDTADYRTERLFYTAENARFLDRVRGFIEREYPEEGPERNLLLAMLIYEAATHANTSGVFKAFHKGFGGHGKDALGRILEPMQLEYPVLLEAPRASVGNLEAGDWSGGKSVDLCYLDPPYTIHQYGSNYHLLNSVARWDFPDAELDLKADGTLRRKAAIRSDWVETKSPYCSREGAAQALKGLLDRIDARFIVLSYNSDGIIPLEELMELMSAQGKLELYTEAYTQYRGGKQGLNRRNATTEFQLLITRGLTHSLSHSAAVERSLLLHQVRTLLDADFHPRRFKTLYPTLKTESDLFGTEEQGLAGFWRPQAPPLDEEDLAQMGLPQLRNLKSSLESALFRDNGEEAETLLEMLGEESNPKLRNEMVKRFLTVLRKLAHKKYRELFEELHVKAVEAFSRWEWISSRQAEALAELQFLAERRFRG